MAVRNLNDETNDMKVTWIKLQIQNKTKPTMHNKMIKCR